MAKPCEAEREIFQCALSGFIKCKLNIDFAWFCLIFEFCCSPFILKPDVKHHMASIWLSNFRGWQWLKINHGREAYIGQVNVPVKSRGDSRSQRSVRSPETDVVQPLGTDVTGGFMKTVSWKVFENSQEANRWFIVKICSLLCIDVYGCKKLCKHDFTTNESFEPGFFTQNLLHPSELVSCGFSYMQTWLHGILAFQKNVIKKAHGDNNPFQKKRWGTKNTNKTHKIYNIYIYTCVCI